MGRSKAALTLGHNTFLETAKQTVVDIIMDPRETRLLRYARDLGCRVQYGQPMMDCQMKAMGDFLKVAQGPKRDD